MKLTGYGPVARFGHAGRNGGEQFVDVEGLGQEIIGAEAFNFGDAGAADISRDGEDALERGRAMLPPWRL